MRFKILFILCLFILSCNNEEVGLASTTVNNPGNGDDNNNNDDPDFPDWSSDTHGNDTAPNYTEVFSDENAIRRIDIVFEPENWALILEDMTSLYGAFGQGSGGGPGGGGPGGGGPGGFAEENPIFTTAEVYYDGLQWYHVGVRFKGNSSLSFSWRNGVWKMSFKLDFDEFEDEFPEISNQRFYGFKQLNLKNNFDDESQLREKIASDIFKESGLPSPRTQFYEVYVDHGTGPIYFGLYTMVEEPDNTLLASQFNNDNGNLYKPDGNGARFTQGSFSPEYFIKQSNELESDWSDVEAVFSALHDSNRTSNPSVWRSGLESVFDVDGFLNYLAVNTVIQNWDTYGRMTHNYYLYGDPENNNALTWIPWDNNESLQFGKMGGSLPLDFSGVGNNWPLIRYLYDDSVYQSIYDNYVSNVINNAFETGYIQSVYSSYASQIEASVVNEQPGYTFLESPADFQVAVSELINHASERASAVSQYLD